MSTVHCTPSTPLAVAVSGGADSMALLLMAHAQHKKIVALTVDHGLRAESADEARQVARWCEARGIEQHTLKPSPLEGGGGIQERARELRYQLLTDWCKAHGVSYLLTAHHRGDQAETLFFRLARGSGIMGLACMAPVSDMHGVTLVRPLLSHSKKSLEDYLHSQKQDWIEDPSNQSPKYTRNVIRKYLQASPDADAIEARAAALADKFGRIRAVIERQLEQAMAQVVESDEGGSAMLRAEIFAELPPEIARLMLSRLTQKLGDDAYPPRSEKIERLYQNLKNKQTKRATLGGLLFSYQRKSNCYDVRQERCKG